MIKYFGANTLSYWESNMDLDRNIIGRSVKLGLVSRSAAERLFHTMDDYMLQMHSEKIATVLESLTSFAHRIIPLINKDPDAPCWWINDQILVQRRHWFSFSRRVNALVSIISECIEKNIRQNNSNSPGENLCDAARATALLFCRQ